MALDKPGLQNNLTTFFTSMAGGATTPAQQAAQWATIIDTYVKTGTVSGLAPVASNEATITNLPVS